MADNRRILVEGTEICINEVAYIIESIAGRGASSIVYRAKRIDNDKFYIIKEFYPIETEAVRGDDNLLTFPTLSDRLENKREKFKKSYDKLIELQRDKDIVNYMVDLVDNLYVDDERNYAYYVEGFSDGSSVNLNEIGLDELLYVLMRTTQALNAVHKKFLYLDLKPANIFYAQKGEYIKLFDLDNSISPEDLRNSDTSVLREIGTTREFASSEVRRALKGDRYALRAIDFTSDYYGIGVILLNYLLGSRCAESLYPSYYKEDIYNELRKCDILKSKDPALVREIAEFVSVILELQPEDRRFPCDDQDGDEDYHYAKAICNKLEVMLKLATNPLYFKSSDISSGDIFVGRKEQLTEITDILNEEQIVCLHAEAGMGKSSLARKYAEDERSNYDAIFTVSYAEHPSISKMIEFVYDKYVVKNGRSRDDNYYDKVRLLKNYFQTARGLLIVDDFDYIKGELPIDELKDIEWKIILTSRSSYVHDFGKTLDLEPISDQRELFIGYYNLIAHRNNNAEYDHKYDTYLDEIIAYLEGNTLAIELFARNAAINRIAIDSLLRSIKREINNEDSIHDVNPTRDDHRINDNSYFVIRRVFNLFKEVDGRKILKEEELFFIYLFALINIPRPEEYILYKLQLSDEKKSDFTGIYERLWTAGWIKKRSYNKGSSANPIEGTEYYLRNIMEEVAYADLNEKFDISADSGLPKYCDYYKRNTLFEILCLGTLDTLVFKWPEGDYCDKYLDYVDKIQKHIGGSELSRYCKANLEIYSEIKRLQNNVIDRFKEYNNQRKEIDFDPNRINDYGNLRDILKRYDDIVEIYRFNGADLKHDFDYRNNKWFWNWPVEKQKEFLFGMMRIGEEPYRVCDKMGYEVTEEYVVNGKTTVVLKPVCLEEGVKHVPVFTFYAHPPFVKWTEPNLQKSPKELAMRTVIKLAECGYGEYQFLLGKALFDGDVFGKDVNKAIGWLKASSEKIADDDNHHTDYAAYLLGEIFANDDVVADIDKAIYYYKKAGQYCKSKEKAEKLEQERNADVVTDDEEEFKFDLAEPDDEEEFKFDLAEEPESNLKLRLRSIFNLRRKKPIRTRGEDDNERK